MRCACRRWAAKLWGNRWAAKLWAAKLWGNQIRTLASTGGCKRRDLPAHCRASGGRQREASTPFRMRLVCHASHVNNNAKNHEGGAKRKDWNPELAEQNPFLEHHHPYEQVASTHDAAFHTISLCVIHCCFAMLGSCAIGAHTGCESSTRDAGRRATNGTDRRQARRHQRSEGRIAPSHRRHRPGFQEG